MTAVEFQLKLSNLDEDLMRFACRLTADKEDAKDLVQDTFLKALTYSSKFKYESNLKAWTYVILRNTFINQYRRSKNRNTLSLQAKDGYLLYTGVPAGSISPDSEYCSKELEKTIGYLSENFKIPFIMYHEGFRYKEIAEALNLQLGTVKSRIFFARKQLQDQIER
jgi:RNA polymerase sigma factor (sigma-70 family)